MAVIISTFAKLMGIAGLTIYQSGDYTMKLIQSQPITAKEMITQAV